MTRWQSAKLTVAGFGLLALLLAIPALFLVLLFTVGPLMAIGLYIGGALTIVVLAAVSEMFSDPYS